MWEKEAARLFVSHGIATIIRLADSTETADPNTFFLPALNEPVAGQQQSLILNEPNAWRIGLEFSFQ